MYVPKGTISDSQSPCRAVAIERLERCSRWRCNITVDACDLLLYHALPTTHALFAAIIEFGILFPTYTVEVPPHLRHLWIVQNDGPVLFEGILQKFPAAQGMASTLYPYQ